jgi:N-acetylmuramic acid 6-phosphate etherase
MVEVQAVNQKLVRRSESILRRLTGCGAKEASEALRQANGNVKLAILLLHGCDLKEAKSVLGRASGQLRPALAALGKPVTDLPDLSDLAHVDAPKI